MSSDLQSYLLFMQWNSYVSLTLLTATLYDYILVLPKEIKYIWSKQWTWVSMLYILIRYCGLLSLVSFALYGSIFVPGPKEVCGMMYLIMQWSYLLFFGAADFIMILRVWAMYNQSRLILGILLVLFLVEVASTVAYYAFNDDPKNSTWVTGQILEYSYCTLAETGPAPLEEIVESQMAYSAQILFSVILCMLATIQFVRQSLQMYRVSKQWQLNRYIDLLVKQGIVYFFAFLLLNGIILLYNWGVIPSNNGQDFLVTFVEYVPVFTLAPRFVISIRELYEHDTIQGMRGGGIDSGFGLSMLSDHGAARSRIMFASRVENEATDDIEADAEQDVGAESIQMVPRDVESA